MRDQPGWDRAAQWGGRSSTRFFLDTAHTFPTQLDAGLACDDGREFTTTPLGMDGPVLQGVLIDEVIEIAFQCARDFGRAPGARAIHQPLRAVAGKAVDPLAEGGIGKGEGVRDGVQALPFDDLTHGLGTAEDARLFRLFQEGI